MMDTKLMLMDCIYYLFANIFLSHTTTEAAAF